MSRVKKEVTQGMEYYAQRRLWNEQGFCAREACARKHDAQVNSGNRLLYCFGCSIIISQGGRVKFHTQEST